MPEIIIPYITTEMIAKNACHYAREHILKGSTQIVNNSFDTTQQTALKKGIRDLRALCDESPDINLEIDNAIQNFYRTITACKKLSLGNCYEQALMALDYVLRHAPPDTVARVYEIQGGDHVFLVIGQKNHCNDSDPKTWGDDAYICDPWANDVYPASEYLAKTKNFFSRYDEKTNCNINHIEDFDPTRHSLKPIYTQSTEYLKRSNSQNHLKRIVESYETKLNHILNTLETLEAQLNAIIERLKNDLGKTEKREIIEKIANALQAVISQTKNNIDHSIKNMKDLPPYEVLHEQLKRDLTKTKATYAKAINLHKKERLTLARYNNHDSFKARVLRFFSIPPKTVRDIHKALTTADQQIEHTLKTRILI